MCIDADDDVWRRSKAPRSMAAMPVKQGNKGLCNGGIVIRKPQVEVSTKLPIPNLQIGERGKSPLMKCTN